jgi:hypothetical protein
MLVVSAAVALMPMAAWAGIPPTSSTMMEHTVGSTTTTSTTSTTSTTMLDCSQFAEDDFGCHDAGCCFFFPTGECLHCVFVASTTTTSTTSTTTSTTSTTMLDCSQFAEDELGCVNAGCCFNIETAVCSPGPCPSTTTTSTTTTTTMDLCGNGNIDPGEDCDPPSPEICNNLQDDDGDMLIDCEDPDCAPLTQPTCGADCKTVPPCQPIEHDPATIRFKGGDGPDRMSIHGRFPLQSPMDASTEGFGIVLTNADGIIFRAQAPADQFRRRKGGNGAYWFRDRSLRRGQPLAGGIARVSVRTRTIHGIEYLVFKVRVYADLSAATVPLMTTQVVVGNDAGSLTAEWRRTGRGWSLALRDYY